MNHTKSLKPLFLCRRSTCMLKGDVYHVLNEYLEKTKYSKFSQKFTFFIMNHSNSFKILLHMLKNYVKKWYITNEKIKNLCNSFFSQYMVFLTEYRSTMKNIRKHINGYEVIYHFFKLICLTTKLFSPKSMNFVKSSK